jgi:WD40 repeat protein
VLFFNVATGEQEDRTFVGSADGCFCAAWSPDGKLLAAGSGGGTVLLYDLAADGQRRRLLGRNAPLRAAAWSPDGKLLATGSGYEPGRPTRQITLWDATAGRELRRLEAHGDEVTALAFAPGGATLAAADEDGGVCLWRVRDGKELHALAGHKGPVNCLAFSPDGRLLASGGADGTVRLWDAAAGKERRALRGPGGAVRRLVFAPDGKELAALHDDNAVCLWDVATGAKKAQHRRPGLEVLAYGDDGRLLGFGPGGTDTAGFVVLWDVAAGKAVRHFQAPQGLDFRGLALSPDGRCLAGMWFNIALNQPLNMIWTWEVATGKPRRQFDMLSDRRVTALAFRPDGRAFATADADGTTVVWDGYVLPPRTSFHYRLDNTDAVWGELAEDADRAYVALCQLASNPEEAAALLRERLRPVPAFDGARLKRLIAQLDDDSFAVREKAAEELLGMAAAAEATLRELLTSHPSAEVRSRLRTILGKIKKGQEIAPAAEALRTERSLEVLERLGTPAARLVLDELARGVPGAALTRQARAACRRLDAMKASPR